MNYKCLMVAVDEGEASDNRIHLASDLAVEFDARLIGTCGVPLSSYALNNAKIGGALPGDVMTLLRDAAESEVRTALARFHELVGCRPDRTECRGRPGLQANVLVGEARAADLVIVGRRPVDAPSSALDPADVLMSVGCPVLVVPPDLVRDPVRWPAMLAWKDGREAQRAAIAALPLLRRATLDHVVEHATDAAAEDAHRRVTDVATWLRRHGVNARAHVENSMSVPAAALLAFAAASQVGLIVAGAYGHSRMGEWSLGGVTRTLLSETPVCLLLSH